MIANGEKFALLRGAQRVWAISSVHGEAERLRALHEAISRQFQPGDRLVYLGNILGHGPDVTDAVDEVLAFRRAVISAHGMFAADVVVLRGAQEEMWQKLLQLQLALNSGEVFDWMMEQGVGATLKSYGGDVSAGRVAARAGAAMCARWTASLRDQIHGRSGHTQLMSALRRAAVNLSPDGQPQLLFVNAGLIPSARWKRKKTVSGGLRINWKQWKALTVSMHGSSPGMTGRCAALPKPRSQYRWMPVRVAGARFWRHVLRVQARW